MRESRLKSTPEKTAHIASQESQEINTAETLPHPLIHRAALNAAQEQLHSKYAESAMFERNVKDFVKHPFQWIGAAVEEKKYGTAAFFAVAGFPLASIWVGVSALKNRYLNARVQREPVRPGRMDNEKAQDSDALSSDSGKHDREWGESVRALYEFAEAKGIITPGAQMGTIAGESEHIAGSDEERGGAIFENVDFHLEKDKTVDGELAAIVHSGGRPEKPNEDRILLDEAYGQYASIDGMGGEAGGAKAAQIMAEELNDGFALGRTPEEIQMRAHERMKAENLGGACYMAFEIKENKLHAFGAGDVELKIFRDGIPVFETIPEHGSKPGEVSNAVTGNNAGGVRPYEYDLEPGDVIISGSDGFWENFENPQEVADLIKGKSPEEAARRLNAAVMKKQDEGGYKDNVNFIIKKYEPKGRLRISHSMREDGNSMNVSEEKGQLGADWYERTVDEYRRKLDEINYDRDSWEGVKKIMQALHKATLQICQEVLARKEVLTNNRGPIDRENITPELLLGSKQYNEKAGPLVSIAQERCRKIRGVGIIDRYNLLMDAEVPAAQLVTGKKVTSKQYPYGSGLGSYEAGFDERVRARQALKKSLSEEGGEDFKKAV